MKGREKLLITLEKELRKRGKMQRKLAYHCLDHSGTIACRLESST